jgi:hypothetical protein
VGLSHIPIFCRRASSFATGGALKTGFLSYLILIHRTKVIVILEFFFGQGYPIRISSLVEKIRAMLLMSLRHKGRMSFLFRNFRLITHHATEGERETNERFIETRSEGDAIAGLGESSPEMKKSSSGNERPHHSFIKIDPHPRPQGGLDSEIRRGRCKSVAREKRGKKHSL